VCQFSVNCENVFLKGGKRFATIPFIDIEEEFDKPKGKERKISPNGLLSCYYKKLKSFAPAATQSLPFLLISPRRMVGGVALLWKTLALCSFQIVQLTSILREAIALRFGEAL
jgi:hypothetical protein